MRTLFDRQKRSKREWIRVVMWCNVPFPFPLFSNSDRSDCHRKHNVGTT